MVTRSSRRSTAAPAAPSNCPREPSIRHCIGWSRRACSAANGPPAGRGGGGAATRRPRAGFAPWPINEPFGSASAMRSAVFSGNAAMPPPDIISDYLDTLSRELSFDTLLAQRVRQEVEDHLSEAVAAEPEDDSGAAQRRAIRNFGDPRAIASEYAC